VKRCYFFSVSNVSLRRKLIGEKNSFRHVSPKFGEGDLWMPSKVVSSKKHETNTIPPCLILLETMKVKNPSAKTMLTKSILFQINI